MKGLEMEVVRKGDRMLRWRLRYHNCKDADGSGHPFAYSSKLFLENLDRLVVSRVDPCMAEAPPKILRV